ncbi:MAG: energy-coupled thiamine transporter ThiT [Lachnospiraceae bacterium]|nr:energy-coupled thiamine transporter ThiT [Lachnospiraceae bacterium]
MSSTVSNNRSIARNLVEAAIMVAIATVLSLIKILDLPYGGSVTIACMLPIVIISYRNGIRWGILTGVVFGIIQQLLGLNTLSYVTTWQSILAVILLDYIIAFMVSGLGGIFRKTVRSQSGALLLGSIFICILRYICHVISGATVWAGLSIPTNAALIYSFGYNATYMIPETIVTAVMAYYIGSMLDFREESVTRMRTAEKKNLSVFNVLGGLVLMGTAIFDAVLIFSHLQNPETGEFDITGMGSAGTVTIKIGKAKIAEIATGLGSRDLITIGIVSGCAVVIAVIFFVIAKKREKNSN